MSSAKVETVGGDQERDEQPIVDESGDQEQPKNIDLDDNHLIDEDKNNKLKMTLPEVVNTCEKSSQLSSTEPIITSAIEAPTTEPGLLDEIKRQSRKSRKRMDSCQNLCQLAESFCFGPLDNTAFFRVFNEYTKRRRRLSYTELFEDTNKKIEPTTVSVSDLFLHYGNLQRMDEFQRFDF